jgi:hypothetical protein
MTCGVSPKGTAEKMPRQRVSFSDSTRYACLKLNSTHSIGVRELLPSDLSQAVPNGNHRCLGPVGDFEFCEDSADVIAYGSFR